MNETKYTRRAWRLREQEQAQKNITCAECGGIIPKGDQHYVHCEDGDPVCTFNCYQSLSEKVEVAWNEQPWN